MLSWKKLAKTKDNIAIVNSSNVRRYSYQTACL